MSSSTIPTTERSVMFMVSGEERKRAFWLHRMHKRKGIPYSSDCRVCTGEIR